MTSKRDYSDVDGTTERIVGVFDVLGFRSSLRTIGTNKLVRSYAAAIGNSLAILQQSVDKVYWHVPAEYVEDEGFPGSSNSFAEPRIGKASLFPGIEEIVVFSDSIFIFGVNDDPEVLRHVLRSAVALFRVFLQAGLPLAGAIAKGDAVVDKRLEIYAGSGIVSAYELANSVDIVGVVIHPDVPKLGEGMSEPMKVPRKEDCGVRPDPLDLMVPVAAVEDPQLSQIHGDWGRLVAQQVTRARPNEKVLAKWKHSQEILSAILNAKITIQ